ncbi:MAG: hypothetical protein M0C28_43595 [Candidatus Moduliflexus flocculans]|nr:hypothetical protein [Candidatus Moduliflexus flocculans]
MEVLAAWSAASREMAAAEEVKNFIAKLVLATIRTIPPWRRSGNTSSTGRVPGAPLPPPGLQGEGRPGGAGPAVSYDDVGELFEDVAAHRVILNFDAEADGIRKRDVLLAARNAVRREFFER